MTLSSNYNHNYGFDYLALMKLTLEMENVKKEKIFLLQRVHKDLYIIMVYFLHTFY